MTLAIQVVYTGAINLGYRSYLYWGAGRCACAGTLYRAYCTSHPLPSQPEPRDPHLALWCSPQLCLQVTHN